MKNKSIRYILILIYLSMFTNGVYGKCRMFHITTHANEVPYIVEGIVVQSNKSSLSFEKPQEHHFTIKVVKVLKGNITDKYLKVHYVFRGRKPSIMSFDIEDRYIFAIQSIDDGNATLLGRSCGLSGISFSTDNLIKINAQIQKAKNGTKR